MQYSLIILVQGFCPLKTKVTQFPGGFRLFLASFLANFIDHPTVQKNILRIMLSIKSVLMRPAVTYTLLRGY